MSYRQPRRRYQSAGACRRLLNAKEVGRVDNGTDISNSCWSRAAVRRLLDLSTCTRSVDGGTATHPLMPAVIFTSCCCCCCKHLRLQPFTITQFHSWASKLFNMRLYATLRFNYFRWHHRMFSYGSVFELLIC